MYFLMIIKHGFDVLADDPSLIRTAVELAEAFLGAATFML